MNIFIDTHAGRVVLHIVAMCGDHEWHWHWVGIVREFHQH